MKQLKFDSDIVSKCCKAELYRSDLIQYKKDNKFYFRDHNDLIIHQRCSTCNYLVISEREVSKVIQEKQTVFSKIKIRLSNLMGN